VWVTVGGAVGMLILLGYLLGVASGWWSLLPASGLPAKVLPNALPANPGDCRPVAVPLKGRAGHATGKICLLPDGTWELAPAETPAPTPAPTPDTVTGGANGAQ